jgi:hypothetical protein
VSDNKEKLRWSKPVLKRLEPTDRILDLIAKNTRQTAPNPMKRSK